MRIKVSYIVHMPGHKDSDGKTEKPWVIKSHETGKIISSHSSKKDAEEHLKQIQYFKHKGEVMEFKQVKSLDQLLKQAKDITLEDIPKDELSKGIKVESEHEDTIKNTYNDLTGKDPSPEDLKKVEKSIVLDHEIETYDEVKEPVYYEDYLLPMEEEMKEDGKGEKEPSSDIIGKAKIEIQEFLKKNPTPEDEEVHDLADKLKINKHEFEEIIDNMLAKELEDKKSFIGYKNLDTLIKIADASTIIRIKIEGNLDIGNILQDAIDLKLGEKYPSGISPEDMNKEMKTKIEFNVNDKREIINFVENQINNLLTLELKEDLSSHLGNVTVNPDRRIDTNLLAPIYDQLVALVNK